MYEIEKLDKIIEVLKKVRSLPVKKVEEEIKSLKMNFSDWCSLTNNENPYPYHTVVNDLHYREIRITDENMMKYDEYIDIISRFGFSDYAETLDEKRSIQMEVMRRQIKEYGYAVLDEEEIPYEYVQKLKEIRSLWNEVKRMNDPIQEVLGTCYSAISCLGDCRNWDDMEYIMNGFRTYTGYIKEKYGEDSRTEALQEMLIETMQKGVERFKSRTAEIPKDETNSIEPYKEIEDELRANEIKELEEMIFSYREALEELSATANKEQGTKTSDSTNVSTLEGMSVQELMEMIARNDETILQNKTEIKKLLIKRILGQQQQIETQEAEMARLSGQKEQN